MNWKKISAIIILLIAITGAWYFLYFIKTPVYSLKLAHDAIQTHNVDEFKKHVDVNSIIDSSYDEIVEAQLDINNIKDSNMRSFLVSISQSLKPKIVHTLTQIVYEKLAGTESTTKEQVDPGEVQEFMDKTGINALKFKEIGSSTTTDGIADVPLVFHSDKLNKDITLHVEMRKNNDGTWQAFKIKNLKEYIIEINNLDNQANASENTN